VREPKQQDICYATQNRQDAVKVLAPQVDVVIVVGSPTSSNSNRLRELAERLGTPAYMVDSRDDLKARMAGRPQPRGPDGRRVGARRAGAAVIAKLRALGATSVRSLPAWRSTVQFPLPMGLGDKSMAELSSSRS
jgi:4-hydroxy-3-methylbut-2-enyl diphosphate reductase